MIRYVEVGPSADLSAWIACFWSLVGHIDAGHTAANRVLPDGCMDVILRFGDPPLNPNAGDGLRAYFVGAMTAPFVVWQVGRVDMMGVRFRPGGATAFTGLPANELTDAVVRLDTLCKDASEFVERTGPLDAWDDGSNPPASVPSAALAARASLRARAREIETLLRRRLAPSRTPDPVVAAAMDLIDRSAGRMRIAAIEDQLAVTQRSLERRFRAEVGLSPKFASRVVRFQAAAAALRGQPRAPLARLAAEHGYHDQAHMTREFRHLSGLTPAGYGRERRVGFVQDEPASHD
jgi:methylphosphotriester-DNA--protein-cysteine methyltransferase